MSTLRTNTIIDTGGGNTTTINGITPAIASQAEAETGTDNTKLMTPLRLRNALNAEGSAPTYACRAWVNFNGTGTVAIRASGNVSSITDNGTGDYTINFTTAMPSANYAAILCGNSENPAAADYGYIPQIHPTVAPTTSALRVVTPWTGNGGMYDVSMITAAIVC